MNNEPRNNNEGVNNIRDRRPLGPPEYKEQILERVILIPAIEPAPPPMAVKEGRISHPFGKRRKSTSIF